MTYVPNRNKDYIIITATHVEIQQQDTKFHTKQNLPQIQENIVFCLNQGRMKGEDHAQ
jgi:ribosomal protein L27